jgi:hypothetical protein
VPSSNPTNQSDPSWFFVTDDSVPPVAVEDLDAIVAAPLLSLTGPNCSPAETDRPCRVAPAPDPPRHDDEVQSHARGLR